MSDSWIVGQMVRLSVAVTDATGAAAAPGTLTLRVKSPSAVVTSYNVAGGGVVADGTGAFHADIALDEAGQYVWRWEAGAPNAGADEGIITVARSAL